MIESPVLQQLRDEWTREGEHKGERRAIIDVLVARFGAEAGGLGPALETVAEGGRLKQLVRLAATCPDLEVFLRGLAP